MPSFHRITVVSMPSLPTIRYKGTLVWRPFDAGYANLAVVFVRNRHGNFVVDCEARVSDSIYREQILNASKGLTFNKDGTVLNRKANRCSISCPKGIHRE